MEKAILKVNGKDYELKFTLGFWRKIKEACGVTNTNLEAKINEDFGTVVPLIILNSIQGEEIPTLQEIEDCLDRSVIDVIEQALINGMTKAEKELLEIVKKKRTEAIDKMMVDEVDTSKK